MTSGSEGSRVEAHVHGEVAALWRYPVKSMQGESLDRVTVTPRGLVGDRAYALIDATTGRISSARHAKEWPRLLDFRAAFTEPPRTDFVPPVRITLPDGSQVRSDDAHVDAVLSSVFGRPVALRRQAGPRASAAEAASARARLWSDRHRAALDRMGVTTPPGTLYDAAALSLLTTGTLDRFRALHPASRWDVRRFRPNIVVRVDHRQGFVENEWVGRTLQVGADVRMRAIAPVLRCVVTTLAQDDLPADGEVLKAAARHNLLDVPGLEKQYPCAGVYADTVTEGELRRGDAVGRA